MTATPLLVREQPPMPEREATLNYEGGSFTASRGLVSYIFKSAAFVSTCAFVEVERKRNSYTRTEYIGADVKVVPQTTWTQHRYPSQTKSIAAGGEPIQIKVAGEWWTARLSGNHESFMKFLCDSKEDMYGPIAWRSARGTLYGPISPTNYQD